MKGKALKVVQRIMNATLVQGLEVWKDKTTEEKQMKAKALKVVQRIMNGALVSTFERWRDLIIEEKKMKGKALKVVQRIMNAALVQGLDLWRHNTAKEKRMRAKALKLVYRVINTTLVQALDLWKEKTVDHKRVKAKARKVGQWFMNRTLVMNFKQWKDQTTEGKKMRAKARKVGQRFMNRTLVMNFKQWKDQTREGKKMKAKARKVGQRMMNATLWQVFELWRDKTTEKKQMKAKALKVVLRIMNATLVQGFELWRDQMVLSHRVLSSALEKTLYGWYGYSIQAKQIRYAKDKCTRILRKVLKGKMSSAFETWAQFVCCYHNAVQQSVSLIMPCEFDTVMERAETKKKFDEHLKTQICSALDIPRESVTIFCHQAIPHLSLSSTKEESIMVWEKDTLLNGFGHLQKGIKVEIVMSDVPKNDGSGLRRAHALAKSLAMVCVNNKGNFSSCGLRLCATEALFHGPMSQALLESVQESFTLQKNQISFSLRNRVIYIWKRRQRLKISRCCWGKMLRHCKNAKRIHCVNQTMLFRFFRAFVLGLNASRVHRKRNVLAQGIFKHSLQHKIFRAWDVYLSKCHIIYVQHYERFAKRVITQAAADKMPDLFQMSVEKSISKVLMSEKLEFHTNKRIMRHAFDVWSKRTPDFEVSQAKTRIIAA